jgi:hypothetical protein
MYCITFRLQLIKITTINKVIVLFDKNYHEFEFAIKIEIILYMHMDCNKIEKVSNILFHVLYGQT